MLSNTNLSILENEINSKEKLRERISELEAWQKEAASVMRVFNHILKGMNKEPLEIITARIDQIKHLLKQAEDST